MLTRDGTHIKRWGIMAVIAVVGAAVMFAFMKSPQSQQSEPLRSSEQEKKITINGNVITAEVADTDVVREKGLGDRYSLEKDAGMLFVFEKDDSYSFWMKDMRFPIDIIWIASDGSVVDVYENVSPDTYPHTFSPRAPARYVLELTAHAVKRFNIRIGDIVRL